MLISKREFNELRHPKEESRFYLTLFVLIPVGFLIAALTVATFGVVLLSVPVIFFILWFGLRLAVANWMNNLVRISENSFPEVHAAIIEAKELFGYQAPVEAYVVDDGSYNASLLPLLTTKFLLLNSELLKDSNSKDEIRFIVGRFVGSLAARHYRFGWLSFLIDSTEKVIIFNIFLFPYERAVVMSGDRLGLRLVCGDINAAVSCLIKTQVGSALAGQVNVQAYVNQGETYKGSFFSWLARAFSRFPHNCARVSELITFAEQRKDLLQVLNPTAVYPSAGGDTVENAQDTLQARKSFSPDQARDGDSQNLEIDGVSGPDRSALEAEQNDDVITPTPLLDATLGSTRAAVSVPSSNSTPPPLPTEVPSVVPATLSLPGGAVTKSGNFTFQPDPSIALPIEPPNRKSWWSTSRIVGSIAVIMVAGVVKFLLQQQDRNQTVEADRMLRGSWVCAVSSADSADGLKVVIQFGTESGRKIARYDFEIPVPDVPGVVARTQLVYEWSVHDGGEGLREYPVLIDVNLEDSSTTIRTIYDIGRMGEGNYQSTLREASVNGATPPDDQKNELDKFVRETIIDPMLADLIEDSTIESITDKKLSLQTDAESLDCAR